MFEWFQAGLDAQKRLIDLQSRQIKLFEDMLKTGQAQGSLDKVAEMQKQALQNWLGLWGAKR